MILALGISSTTAIFSIIDIALFRPRPWPHADRLVAVYGVLPDRRVNPADAKRWNRMPVSWEAWRHLQQLSVFDEVGVWFPGRIVLGTPAIDTVPIWYASSSLFALLGAQPAMGRLLSPDEDLDVSSTAVLISQESWIRRYGGRPDILGTQAVLSIFENEPLTKTIVGVLPPDFGWGEERPEFVLPMGGRIALASYPVPAHYAIARLAPGVSMDTAAEAARAVVVGSMDDAGERSARLVWLVDDVIGEAAPPLWVLLAGAGMLLLIACANVAGLFIAEARARQHEIAVRRSLGATGGTILRQLAFEQCVVSLAAAGAALLLLAWVLPLLTSVIPPNVLDNTPAAMNVRVVMFAIALGSATAITFGMFPALALSRTAAVNALRAGRAVSAGAPFRGAHRLVLVAQLVVALVLIVCTMLFGETLGRLQSRSLGFDPRNLAVVSIKATAFPDIRVVPGELPLFSSWSHTAALLESLRGTPGVVNAAGVGTAPFGGGWQSFTVRAQSGPVGEKLDVHVQVVTDGYFETLSIPLLSGRLLQRGDRSQAIGGRTLRVVISAAVERRLFDGHAVGRKLVRDTEARSDPFVYEIVGVVGDAKQREYSDESPGTMYLLDSTYKSINDLVIRTAEEPAPLLDDLRRAVQSYDSGLLITSVATMDSRLQRSVGEERFRAALTGVFGAAALVLAMCGAYSLMSRRAAERRLEVGIRMALGASDRDIRALLVREAVGCLAWGMIVGLPLALLAGAGVRAMLFGVTPTALHVLPLAGSLMSIAVIAAAWIPARRAGRAQPTAALRNQT